MHICSLYAMHTRGKKTSKKNLIYSNLPPYAINALFEPNS